MSLEADFLEAIEFQIGKYFIHFFSLSMKLHAFLYINITFVFCAVYTECSRNYAQCFILFFSSII